MKRLIKRMAAIPFFSVLLAYWIGSEVYYARSIRPVGISTVSDYLARFDRPRNVYYVEHEGRNYFVLESKLHPAYVMAFPSSPPAYVFDEEGRFVDWCSDPGNRPSQWDRWATGGTNGDELGTFKMKHGL